MARRITKQPDIRGKDDRRSLEQGLYWADLTGGLHLGYRKGTRGGKWLARAYVGDQQYRRIKVGTADDDATANGVTVLNFAQAATRARKKQVEAAQPAGPITVREAFDQYVAGLLPPHKRTARQSREARTNLDLHVPQKLFDKPVAKLTQDDVETIRDGLVKMKPEEANDPEIQRRKKATANRVMATVKAALNRAYRKASNQIPSNAAWREVKNFKNVRGSRTVFLDDDQQRRLINSSQGSIRNFIIACLLTGLRPPHEVGALKVRDFDSHRGVLELTFGKTGSRTIWLTDEAITFFKGLAAGRDPDAPLVPRDDGKAWATRRNDHLELMQAAVKRAKLPTGTTAYTLRHSYISSAMLGGMPLKIIADNTGTSVAMIEKHYGKFAVTSRRQLVAAHGPVLGLGKAGKVVAIAKHPKVALG